MARKPGRPKGTRNRTLFTDLKEDYNELGLDKQVPIAKALRDTLLEIGVVDAKRAKTLKNIGDELVKAVKLEDKIGTSTFQTADLMEDIIKAKREGNIEDEKKLKLAQDYNRVLERENNLLMRQANLVKSIGQKIEDTIKRIPLLGGFLSDFLGATGLGDRMSEKFIEDNAPAAQDRARQRMGSGATGELAANILGPAVLKGGKFKEQVGSDIATRQPIFAEQGKNLNQFAREMISPFRLGLFAAFIGAGIVFTKDLRAGMEKGMGVSGTGRGMIQQVLFGETADAFESEFGKVNSISTVTAGKFKLMSKFAGLTAENAATLSKELVISSDLTQEQSVDVLKTVQGLAKASGVAPKAIFEDMAQNSDMFAQFAQDGAGGLAEAAIKAKTLGLNLSAVSSVAKSLLDFETSISNEFEAQVLTGKMINLDRARGLALQGKASELLDEIVKQVGGEAELRSMNILQMESLAGAVGLSVNQLQRVVQGNEASLKNPVVSKLDETNEILKAQLDTEQKQLLGQQQQDTMVTYG